MYPLRFKAPTRCSCPQSLRFTAENTLSIHQRPPPIQLARKGNTHLGSLALKLPCCLAPLGRDHTHRSEPFVHVAVVVLAVESCARQDHAKWSNLSCGLGLSGRSIAEPL